MLLLYNILFPLGFVFYIPSIIYKLVKRGGRKDNFLERLSIFSAEKRRELAGCRNAVWIHAVSVGETQVALSLIKRWLRDEPGRSFVLSTTTTTGQALAADNAPPGTAVIFCPVDFIWFVRRTLRLLKPSMLVIFETEIWPNMVCESRRAGIPVALVNARISDKSFGGYCRFSFFFSGVLRRFSKICVQTELDGERFRRICPDLKPEVCGNMKFDQAVDEKLRPHDLAECFGSESRVVLLAASTHSGEERLLAEIFLKLKKDFPRLRLVIVPRHAERGGEIAQQLKELGAVFHRRSDGTAPAAPVDVLLADTTGEMLSFMAASDIVFMGKSLAGHDEGHNLIEPALLSKPIVTGAVLKNFRFVLDALRKEDALLSVDSDGALEGAIRKLLENPDLRVQIGRKAKEAISRHKGAAERTIGILKKLIP